MTAQSPRSNRKTLIVALVGGLCLLLALGGTAWMLINYFGSDNKVIVIDTGQKPAQVPIPSAGSPPAIGTVQATPSADVMAIGGIVQDPQGTPINKVNVQIRFIENGAAGTPVRVRTDGMGRWAANIPKDATRVRVLVSQRNYASTTSAPQMEQLLARTAVSVLSHGVDITGVVVNENGVPIAGVKVQPGATATRAVTTDAQGRFTLAHLREGQNPITVISDQYGTMTEQVNAQPGMAPLRFQMRPPMTVTAYDPDGTPAKNAQWGTATAGQFLNVQNGQTIMGQNAVGPARTTGSDGKILAPAGDAFTLVVVDSNGWAQVNSADIPASHEVHLSPWGRVTGKLMIGRNPGVNQQVGVFHQQVYRNPGMQAYVNFGSYVKTDNQGNFVLERIQPGQAVAYLLKQKTIGGNTIGMAGEMEGVNVVAGKTTVVQIGGKGRPIVGRVEIPPELANRKDWYFSYGCRVQEMQDAKATIHNALASLLNRGDSSQIQFPRQYSIDINADGTYRIDDVEAGEYQMYIQAGTGQFGQQQVGFVTSMFTVPPMPGGRSDEPLELPTVKLKMTGR